ncbi:hypothetical protein ACTFIW_011347 [Dictyostelium discoideum]
MKNYKIITLLLIISILFNVIRSNKISLKDSDSGSNGNQDIQILINDILNNCSSSESSSCFGTQWGVVADIYTPTNGEFTNIFSLNELQAFTPASNTKLFTTISIFYTFGEDFKVFTPFYTDKPFNSVGGGSNSNSELDFICVKGMGDPSMSIDNLIEAAKFFSSNPTMKKVNKLLLDTSFYNIGNEVDGNIPSAWEWEDLTSTYGSIPTPLIINENTMDIYITPSNVIGGKPTASFKYSGEDKYLPVIILATTTTTGNSSTSKLNYSFKMSSQSIYITGNCDIDGGIQIITVPILDPEQYFLTVFSALLEEGGVEIGQTAIGSCNYTGMDYKSFEVISPELSEMLNYTLLTSNNLYAETFLRQMGTFNSAASESTPTYQAGLEYIQQTLSIPTSLYTQVDGSGLSRNNFITPKSLITVIENVYTNVGDPQHDYISYLPVASLSGTLSKRFINTPASGIVHAKTGSMTGVNSLTGVILPNGLSDNQQNSIFFSIIANNSPAQNTDIIDIIDQIVILLTKFILSS